MALIQAKHKTYGVVEVPEKWLRLWPEAYRALDAPDVDDGEMTDTADEADQNEPVTDDSSPNQGEAAETAPAHPRKAAKKESK